MNKYKCVIGIDPGVKTGLATWEGGKLTAVVTVKIHEAMSMISDIAHYSLYKKSEILVRFEDARLRKWFGNSGKEQWQGAGSIKRDCKIWEDFLTHYDIPFQAVAPKRVSTKMDANLFKKITGWEKRTSNHARDAAMLCYQFN